MKNLIAKLCGLDATITRLEKHIIDLNAKLTENEDVINFHKSQEYQLEQELNKVRKEAYDRQQELDKSKIDTVQEINEVNAKYDNVYSENQKLAQEILELKDKIKSMGSAIGSYKGQISNLKARLKSA